MLTLIIFLFLLGSAYVDFKTRKVPNYVPMAFVLCPIPFTQGLNIIPIALMSVTCYILFQLRFFGGGDAKMLIALSVVTSTMGASGINGAFSFAVLAVGIAATAIIGIIASCFRKDILKTKIPFMVPILIGYLIMI